VTHDVCPKRSGQDAADDERSDVLEMSGSQLNEESGRDRDSDEKLCCVD
jgi:hypothetical protein